VDFRHWTYVVLKSKKLSIAILADDLPRLAALLLTSPISLEAGFMPLQLHAVSPTLWGGTLLPKSVKAGIAPLYNSCLSPAMNHLFEAQRASPVSVHVQCGVRRSSESVQVQSLCRLAKV
jgi:hypothetical protein